MTLFPTPPLAPKVTEKEWQRTVVEGLQHFGYLVNHVYPLATKDGNYRTSTTLKGWPDLTGIGRQARAGWMLYIECKGVTTPTTPEQLVVLDTLAANPQSRCWLLRPLDNAGVTELVKWIARPWEAPVRFGWTDEQLQRARATSRV